ncbi:MAG: tryptophan synthase subunit alpha [Caulobacteraceae bacterium]
MNRIEARFCSLAEEGRAGFVAYLMAGDPDPETSLAALQTLPAAGADFIELGFPFSDPMAEGPPIQRASARALAAGTTLERTLRIARRFREGDPKTPLILMGYLNPILAFGIESLAREAGVSGVDALIVVDCPFEEAGDLEEALAAEGLFLIRLIAPTTGKARLERLAKGAAGFFYVVSVAGVTGHKEADIAAVRSAVGEIRRVSTLPVAVGFGVRTPGLAAEVARIADAVVVGTALVEAGAADHAKSAGANKRDVPLNLVETARSLAEAVHGARSSSAPDLVRSGHGAR